MSKEVFVLSCEIRVIPDYYQRMEFIQKENLDTTLFTADYDEVAPVKKHICKIHHEIRPHIKRKENLYYVKVGEDSALTSFINEIQAPFIDEINRLKVRLNSLERLRRSVANGLYELGEDDE